MYRQSPSFDAANTLRTLTAILISSLLLLGCNVVESTAAKQIKACTADVQLGLNDPNSLEILSTKTFEPDDGRLALTLEYTAKNALGGRVRSTTVCGFKSKNDTALDPSHRANMEREINRGLRELGIDRTIRIK